MLWWFEQCSCRRKSFWKFLVLQSTVTTSTQCTTQHESYFGKFHNPLHSSEFFVDIIGSTFPDRHIAGADALWMGANIVHRMLDAVALTCTKHMAHGTCFVKADNNKMQMTKFVRKYMENGYIHPSGGVNTSDFVADIFFFRVCFVFRVLSFLTCVCVLIFSSILSTEWALDLSWDILLANRTIFEMEQHHTMQWVDTLCLVSCWMGFHFTWPHQLTEETTKTTHTTSKTYTQQTTNVERLSSGSGARERWRGRIALWSIQ